MDLPLEGPARGKKRSYPIEREMEKCAACRRKKIKCLPINRDWSKGEKCTACIMQNDSCGPKIRADRISRSRITPSSLLLERPLVPSDSPKPSPLELSPTIASDPQRSCYAQSGGSTHDGSYKGTASNYRSTDVATSDASPTSEKTPIESNFSQLGDLRITLKNVMNRLETLNLNAFGNQHPSIASTAETALEILANNLNIEYTNVLKHILVLIQDTEPGPSLELALRRTLEAMESYADITTTPLGLDDTTGSRMTAWRSTVLKRLFEIYETRGDYAEAERFAQKLDLLREKLDSSDSDSETTERLAQSLNRTSRHMRNVLSDIPFPSKYRGLLHFTDTTDPFPSIHRAMLDRNAKVVRFLCESTIQILEDQEDILRRGILHLAAETANEEVLGRLHPQIQDLLGKRDKCMKTPLCVAAQHGDYDFFEKLANLSSHTDLTSKDAQGRSVLALACGAGHFRIAEFLLQNNLSPNDTMSSHCSPLNAAASSGHDSICRALLDYGAWVDWISQDKTASQIAKEHGHDHIVEMISEYQSRPRNLWGTHQGQPPLLSAASEAVRELVARPTTPQRPSPGAWSPSPYGPVSKSTHNTTASDMEREAQFDLIEYPG